MEVNVSMKAKKYRRYTAEFKEDAVRLVQEEGLTAAQVARDLGINAHSLYKWVQAATPEKDESFTESDREELLRLRKENRVLKEEREILKKATAFFAKESK